MEIMEKAIILAYELGIRIVQLAGYDELENLESSSRSVAHFSENLEKSVAFASKYGVTLAIENMGVPFMDSVRKVMQHVERINSPLAAGLCRYRQFDGYGSGCCRGY